MSRTVTALFDTREDAEAGRQRLIAANIDTDNVRIHDKSSEGFREDSYSTNQDPGVWGSVRNAYPPDEDRHAYEEGVRRGGFVLSADVDEDEVDEAVRALEATNCVDLDERSQSWRNEGWTGPQTATSAVGADWDRDRDNDVSTARSDISGEERIPVVDEQLVVGKREVDRGGVRVRSYVTERPVHEQVRLRQEHVNVERRPVDQRLDTATGDAFQERTIEVSERGEEAVVGKEARIVEEVVVSKTADERTEDVSDTVRHTEVDVDQLGDGDRNRSSSAYSTGSTTDDRSRGEGLGEKARDAFQDVKDGLGIGNKNDR